MRLADNWMVSESPDYILDLDGAASNGSGMSSDDLTASRPRVAQPWLAVYWRCCHMYSRIYRNRERTAYEGRCPSCGKFVHAAIGPGGVSSRFFTAG